ncbi:hypothetical protein JMA_29070 [Jeotgalibacillus malaysiensis]|uniref:BIG2 domain-containing protein n=1 Tax=Jeotgalibacillus malaysiensis TaxID=1508404 RepID=A0A0B5AW17_9BACL|nr:cell wall-binding repeat-containing protein [Jeotgalibacillus malaysiensis]AJD92224.1 hypothetical protein JMA_29070 [Jeotgalibacillus malaysiensis]
MKKILFVTLLSLGLLISTFQPGQASAQTDTELVSRLSGEDRYETSLEIAREGWNAAPNVILVTGSNFPDALSASALSKSKDAPIILTKAGKLSAAAISELKALSTKTVYIIGGTNVISTSIEEELKKMSIETTRIAGKDRYETSLKIAQEIGVENGITVAMGSNFPDALSIAPIASSKQMPILLSRKTGLDENIKSFIKNKNIPVSYIIGGTGVLDSSLDKSVPNSKRLSGDTRYETNLSIMKHFQKDLSFEKTYVATGSSFPDALSGSAIASKNDTAIFLTKKESMDASTIKFMKDKRVKNAVILGGAGAVSEQLESELNKELFISVSKVTLNPSAVGIKIGESTLLSAVITPADATNPTVQWSSSNAETATVDQDGKVTGHSIGTAVITATSENGGFKATTEVQVKPINVTSVKLDKSTNTLKIGETDTLTATISPSNATNKTVSWTSSDNAIATVTGEGIVEAKSVGTAIITVKSEDGEFTDVYTLTVKPINVTSIKLDQTSGTLIEGESTTLQATVSPDNATNKEVTWSSSEPAIAEVDANGNITALSAGNAKIIATATDGGYTATFDLTVVPVMIEFVDDIYQEVYQWDDFTLPTQVTVQMNNGTLEEKAVTWNTTEVDTSTIGSITFEGSIENYDESAKLHLEVKHLQDDLLLTGKSSVIINSLIKSYTITLSNYTPQDLKVEKVEIYSNGQLYSTRTKENLESNGVPTTIYSNNRWSIGFDFGFGISRNNSYYIVYIDYNGHSIPCKYMLT